MTTTLDDLEEASKSLKGKLARLEKRGVLLGLDGKQLTLACIDVAVAVTTAGLSTTVFLWLILPVYVPVFILAVASWHREPFLVLLRKALTYMLKKIRGQTLGLRNPATSDPRVLDDPMVIGTPRAGDPLPEIVGSYPLPGGLGAIETVQVPGGGAIMINRKTQVAATTVTADSVAWELRDGVNQEATFDGFVDWLSNLGIPGMRHSVLRIRVDSAPSTHLIDAVEAFDANNAAATTPAMVSEQLKHEYDTLAREASRKSMGFTNEITMVFDVAKMKRDIKQSGKGLVGLAAIISGAVDRLEAGVADFGLESMKWLDVAAADAAISRATDPVMFAVRAAKESRTRRSAVPPVPVMGVREKWSYLQIDGSFHTTYWIAEWPRTNTKMGFLRSLLYTGDATRVISIQIRAVPTHKALARIGRAQSALETANALREKFGTRTTTEQRREGDELDDREEELADGFGEDEYRGFITVSAADKDGLNRGCSEIELAANAARLKLGHCYGQQWPAFVSSALPFGIGGTR